MRNLVMECVLGVRGCRTRKNKSPPARSEGLSSLCLARQKRALTLRSHSLRAGRGIRGVEKSRETMVRVPRRRPSSYIGRENFPSQILIEVSKLRSRDLTRCADRRGVLFVSKPSLYGDAVIQACQRKIAIVSSIHRSRPTALAGGRAAVDFARIARPQCRHSEVECPEMKPS